MVCEAGVAVIFGIGFTVMVTVIGVPEHPFAVGVTVYVTVPAEVPEAVSACAMVDPLPALAPVAPVCEAVQVNVVPGVVELSAILVELLLQTDCVDGVATATGVGNKVTVVDAVPLQPAVVPVTV
jgi:hypothetical protein